jgi:hypothetical protein
VTFIDLVKMADKGYRKESCRSSLLDLVDPETGKPLDPMPSDDTLAMFVVCELNETFDANLDNDSQIQEAIEVVAGARDDLENIIETMLLD